MIFLTIEEVKELHVEILACTGGLPGIRDTNALDSAVAQPRMSFGGEALYPTLAEKAVALGFSLIKNHAFVDGNKRIGHAAMETFLVMNGSTIVASVDEQEAIVLDLAAGKIDRGAFTEWLIQHLADLPE